MKRFALSAMVGAAVPLGVLSALLSDAVPALWAVVPLVALLVLAAVEMLRGERDVLGVFREAVFVGFAFYAGVVLERLTIAVPRASLLPKTLDINGAHPDEDLALALVAGVIFAIMSATLFAVPFSLLADSVRGRRKKPPAEDAYWRYITEKARPPRV